MTYANNIIDIDHLLMIKNGYDVPVYENGVYQSRMDIFVNTVTRVICLYVSDVSVVCGKRENAMQHGMLLLFYDDDSFSAAALSCCSL